MRRTLHIINLAAFLLGLIVIAIVLNFFARQEQWRQRIDATKTRAYSLSPQTQQLLSSLEGPWRIALVMNQRAIDRSIRRQIDEVLSRYVSAAPNLSVLRIDPEDARSMIQYEALLSHLTQMYATPIAEYDRALDAAAEMFEHLQRFAQVQAGVLEQVISLLPADDPTRKSLQQHLGVLALMPEQGRQVESAVDKALRADQSRPLPDYETARSILAEVLTRTATDIDDIAEVFAQWQQRTAIEERVRLFASNTQRDCRQMSQQAAEAADLLKRLPPLELSDIGHQMQKGEMAVILSPSRAAVIPSQQLFPKSNLREMEDGRRLFDQRFRGEQLISAAIRSLTVPHMPVVVFVHSEEQSLLRSRDKQADLVGATSVLRANRYEVAEWTPHKQSTRPTFAQGQPVVWVLVPPAPARTLEPGAPVQALRQAVAQLIQDGEPVLLNLGPNLLAKYGEADPFAALCTPLGVNANTGELIVESTREGAGERSASLGQAIHDFSQEHLIGRAVDGQQAYFGMPVHLQLVVTSGVQQHVIASIAPNENRWLERDWTGDIAARIPDQHQIVRQPLPIVVAVEREGSAIADQGSEVDASADDNFSLQSNNSPRRQRCIIVGSGGWMISNVSDVIWQIGGGRIALVNPGNHELLLACIAWLAGMDDLIAASPISQEIARLRGVTGDVRTRWMWILVAGLPALCVIAGVGVWVVRRR